MTWEKGATVMKTTLSRVLLVAALFHLGAANAAEVIVNPGIGALGTALQAASSGDTLVLTEGAYVGDVTIDKSLTIRAQSRGLQVIIAQGNFVVDGEGISVVLQGLTFDTTLDVSAAGDVKILENRFLANRHINVSDYRTDQGDGDLAIVGNILTAGANITNIYSQDAYVAGNVLENGVIYANAPVWIVGNDVTCLNQYYCIYASNTQFARILGNRVSWDPYNSSSARGAIYVPSGLAIIAGNIIHAEMDYRYGSGIEANGTSYTEITNNVVHDDGDYTGTFYGYGIRGGGAGRVSGNIILGFPTNQSVAITASAGAVVKHNLCYETADTCASDPSNIVADPKFADLTDYRLAADSPAIDAGPPDEILADIDRTRNDMGAYGGPWSIGQYDAQRDPSNLAPYVYPLFTANRSFDGGNMEIRALGVARLR
jgi:hypothetical protein